MGSNLWQALKVFNLFSLLENKRMEMFSMGEQSKNKHKSSETTVWEAEEDIL